MQASGMPVGAEREREREKERERDRQTDRQTDRPFSVSAQHGFPRGFKPKRGQPNYYAFAVIP